MDVNRGRLIPEAGWESLRNAIYNMAIIDYRRKRNQGWIPIMEKKFLLSGAYQMDPDLGKMIVEILEKE